MMIQMTHHAVDTSSHNSRCTVWPSVVAPSIIVVEAGPKAAKHDEEKAKRNPPKKSS